MHFGAPAFPLSCASCVPPLGQAPWCSYNRTTLQISLRGPAGVSVDAIRDQGPLPTPAQSFHHIRAAMLCSSSPTALAWIAVVVSMQRHASLWHRLRPGSRDSLADRPDAKAPVARHGERGRKTTGTTDAV
jgi:hypothetical protein